MKCNQIGCNNIATHRVFWPGQKSFPACKGCAATADGIGRGLGIYIHTEEIPDDTSGESESDSQDSKG